jgi:hypothetical protein
MELTRNVAAYRQRAIKPITVLQHESGLGEESTEHRDEGQRGARSLDDDGAAEQFRQGVEQRAELVCRRSPWPGGNPGGQLIEERIGVIGEHREGRVADRRHAGSGIESSSLVGIDHFRGPHAGANNAVLNRGRRRDQFPNFLAIHVPSGEFIPLGHIPSDRAEEFADTQNFGMHIQYARSHRRATPSGADNESERHGRSFYEYKTAYKRDAVHHRAVHKQLNAGQHTITRRFLHVRRCDAASRSATSPGQLAFWAIRRVRFSYSANKESW